MSTQLVYLVWLIASVIGALLITASPECRHWRKKLLLIVLGVGLVSAGFLIVNIYQRTPFFDAVEAGDLTRVKELLADDPALVRSETFMGSTGLHLAVRSNNSNMVQFLIKAGANVNAEGDGETPLLLAAFYGRPQIAEILLKAGADVNAPGFKDLDPPLNIAAIHGYVDVVKVLLAHGANVNAQNLSHETALDLARQNHQTDVISVLINPPK